MRLEDYFDTSKAAAAALRDWHDQDWKRAEGRDRVTELDAKLLRRVGAHDRTRVGGGGEGDARESVIDKKDAAARGYRRAADYFLELTPAWERLEPEERFMLTARFVDRDEGGGIERIMEKLHVGRTEAYRRSELALQRLAKLLFW